MESNEPAKNDESRGLFKRRISSILKMPQKAGTVCESEQQEYTVEFTKPVEKRKSRRVSFAPANDVLLFSKDVKSTSPVRSPLQDLMTATAATTNRIPVPVTEDEIQPIMGMDTLLNAPLQISQQRDRVNFDMKEDYGEKTMMFFADDVFLDMTQSHTVNIASNVDALTSSRERVPMKTASSEFMDANRMTSGSESQPGDRNMGLSREKETQSLSVPCFDQAFQTFLASIPKSSGPPQTQMKTQMNDVDKENKVCFPKFASVVDKPSMPRRTGEPFYGSALFPEDGVSRDVPEGPQSHTVNIASNVDALTSSRERAPMKTASSEFMDANRLTSGSESQPGDRNMGLSREKETRSLSVPCFDQAFQTFLASIPKSSGPPQTQMKTQMNDVDKENMVCFPKFASVVDKPSMPRRTGEPFYGSALFPEDGVSRDVPEGCVQGSSADEYDFFQSLFPTQGMFSQSEKRISQTLEMKSKQQQSSKALCSSDPKDMTSMNNPVLHVSHQKPKKFEAGDDERVRTIQFSAMDAAMDVTQVHTVNIQTAFNPHKQLNVNPSPAGGERTVQFSAVDAAMDVTQVHTVNIQTAFNPEKRQNTNPSPAGGERTVQFSAVDAAMDVTQVHTVNIQTAFNPHKQLNVNPSPAGGERTVQFSAVDAAMDVTQVHTVNIQTAFNPEKRQNTNPSPAGGERTVQFSAVDAAMDVTQVHTVKIQTAFNPHKQLNVNPSPAGGERTVQFSAVDAAMDVTQVHTVNIQTAFNPHKQLNVNPSPAGGERTVQFSAVDAAMDVTQVHTVNIQTAFNPEKRQNMNPSPAGGERTVQLSAMDAAMDITLHTVNISAVFDPQTHQNVYLLPSAAASDPEAHQNVDTLASNVDSTVSMMNITGAHTHHLTSQPVLNTVHLEQDPSSIFTRGNMDLPLTEKKANATAAVVPSPQEDVDTNADVDQREKRQCGVNTNNKGPGFVQGTTEKPENKALTDCLAHDVSRDKTVVETRSILGPACTDDFPPCLPSEHNWCPTSDHLRATEANMLQSNEESSSDGLKILNSPGSVDSNEAPKKTNESSLVSQTAGSPSAADQHNSESHLENSRQKRLADLQLKIRRLGPMINESPATFVDSCTVPLPQVEHEENKDSTDKSLSVVEPEMEMGAVDVEDRTQAPCHKEGKLASATVTPFNLKTKQLMARLSIGGFKPKLPQRSKPDAPKKAGSSGEHTKPITASVVSHLSKFDHDVSNIFDEELGSCDDVSETLDTSALQQISEKVCSFQELNMDQPVEDWGLEVDLVSAAHVQKRALPEAVEDWGLEVDLVSAAHVQKRLLPEAVEDMGHEKRVKTSPEASFDNGDMLQSGTEAQSHVTKHYGHITTAATVTSQTADVSNSRCEATFESTFKHSTFESPPEGYSVQKKFDDGTITMSEFFKLFNIDFVIHNPRQSVFPATDLLNADDRTPLDLLKDRHINLPKQRVYEVDVLNLTEKVERMNIRTHDLDKPLRLFNRSLWEEMIGLSEEELQLFGAKLRERNNYFRKLSKTKSHEMKEALYSNLLQANMKEQENVRGKIEKADEVIKSLDDCIHDLEAELAAVEKGSDGRPGVRFYEEELKKVTEALTERERQVSEVEMQKKQSLDDINRVKAETRNLQEKITVLHMLSEWKLGKKRDNCTIYTFLYDTMHLHVVYEKSNGQTAGNEPEQKIVDITFKFLLDDAESEFNARLVHKLLSQYIEEQSAWVTKYPTHGHVPQLLHDLSLVVGRCRLLGEELRLLDMWGSLKLDIVDIRSVDTQVSITFSTFRRSAKFEVVFSVSLINQLYVLQLQSFTNMIGDTTKQQIEEIVASISPGKKLLTKVVKKIHETLLC